VSRAALTPFVAVVLAACGDQIWAFEDDAAGVAALDAGVDTGIGTGAGMELDARAYGVRADASRNGCSTDADCMVASLHCDTASGQCVQCVVDSQCTQTGLPSCDRTVGDPAVGRCVQCSDAMDCGPGHTCAPTTHTCVAFCTSSEQCPPSEPSCSADGVCVALECTSNFDCPRYGTCEGHVCVGPTDAGGYVPMDAGGYVSMDATDEQIFR